MGRSAEEAHCAVRFSLCVETTESDIDSVLDALGQVLRDMDRAIHFLPCK
jgi:cysteine sulfinate desulfinase/cysteine desulfurase-like protein